MSSTLPTQKLAISPQKMSGCSVISCGPGWMPWISSAPRISAITASPGMPRLIVGIKSTCVLECDDASGEATPAIMPVPNFSGVLEILRSSA
ncbi:hypothetical protein D9M68_869480 [compost metagenome]